jgi:hypothetical protein
MRKNCIFAIALVDFNTAKLFANADSHKIKAYIDKYNKAISDLTKDPIPVLKSFGN